jgi:ABC-type lipoprotein release transport system permease subunit
LPAVPSQIVGGAAYVITQGSGPYSINESLAGNLSAQPWVALVSPEMLGLGTLAGEPVVVRAAKPDVFVVDLEGGTWINRTTVRDGFAFVGEGLAHRLGLSTGDTVTLVGSYLPRIAFVRIAGVYRTATAANDELLVDDGMGRFLTGLGPTFFHSIRVRTSNPAALVAFLDRFGASAHVSGPSLVRADVHSDPPGGDERLINQILRTGIGGAPRDYLSTAIGEATTSVRVVAYGIMVFLSLLVAFGIHAVQARAFADRVPAVGILRAVGASGAWMRRRLLVETIPAAVLASLLGAGIGFGFASFLQPGLGLVVFGHRVPVSFDLVTLAFLILVLVAVSAGSALLLLRGALRLRPTESIREAPASEPPQSLEAILRG